MSSPASQRSEVDLLPNLNLEDATGGIPLTKRTSYLAAMTTPKYQGDIRSTYGKMLNPKTPDGIGNRNAISIIPPQGSDAWHKMIAF